MPINTVNPYGNSQTVDDARKVMDTLKGKSQSVSSTNSFEASDKTTSNIDVLTPQAVGPAAKVDISKQAKQAASSEEQVETRGSDADDKATMTLQAEQVAKKQAAKAVKTAGMAPKGIDITA